MKRTKIELPRHIDKWLTEWKKNPAHKPALVKGIRQSGKTHSIKRFAKDNYDTVVYLNFWDNPALISAFDGALDIDSLIRELSLKMPLGRLKEGSTVFIFDEIQDCPRALLSLKTNMDERRYDFIASGSYLGINGYIVGEGTPKPVGSVDEFDMRTLDFEEFLYAKGLKEEQVSYLTSSFLKRKPLSKGMHESFNSLFREYLCVGGFPEAVENYISTNNIYSSKQITNRIVNDLKKDFGRRVGTDGKPLFSPNEVARIRSAFSLIPSFLGKENKRYIVSKIEGKGAKDKASDALTYLEEAGIITKVHNLSVPSSPLSINVIGNQFKVFVNDIGILIAMMEDGVSEAIYKGELGMGKGMIYESVVEEALYKRGGNIYYFAKDTGLELDFVVNIGGEISILEVKSKNGNAKSAKTVNRHPEHYGKTKIIYIKDAELNETEGVLTIPHYMAFLLFPFSPTLPVH